MILQQAQQKEALSELPSVYPAGPHPVKLSPTALQAHSMRKNQRKEDFSIFSESSARVKIESLPNKRVGFFINYSG